VLGYAFVIIFVPLQIIIVKSKIVMQILYYFQAEGGIPCA
jgi:hypothetical protein